MTPKSMTTPMIPLVENNIYLFMEDFNSITVKPVIDFILTKNLLPAKSRPDHLTLIINSPGGELTHACALIDVMKGSAIPVHTVGLGQISSCGLLTFMAGAKGNRIITPNTMILSHQYSGGSYGKEHELVARAKYFELYTEIMMNIYKSCTGLSEVEIRKHLLPAEDKWLTAKEAVKYGIADKVRKVF